MLINLFIFIFIIYGASNIVVFSHIFDVPRNYIQKKSQNSGFWKKIYELITCMMCLPTWFGFILSVLDIIFGNICFTPANMVFSDISLWFIPLIIFFDGMIASGVTWIIHTFQEMMERTWPKQH